VAAHGDEPLGLDAATSLHDPDDRGLQVVIANPLRHSAEVLERFDVAVDEDLLGLVEIHAVKTPAAGRQAHHEHPRLDLFAVQIEAHLSEVDLGLVAQGCVWGTQTSDTESAWLFFIEPT